MDMHLKKQIGQMIIAGFPSPTVDGQALTLAREYKIGNFILFSHNMSTARQVAGLCAELSDLVYDQTGLAPFIAADQEGGMVARITEGAALFPGAMALAAGSTPSEVARVGENCGRMLRAMGVNVDFAPVADVNIEPLNPVIGARAYGDDPHKVADFACAMALGMEKGGVLSTVKHYPGHGNVNTDSHLDLPVNDTDPAVLEQTEFVPFQRAFDAGVSGLMSAHIMFPKLDGQLPATLSPAIITDLLRNKQGFEGLVFTDCLEMEAVRRSWGTAEGAVLSVLAGCDILIVSHHLEAAAAACDAIYRAVESGRIPREVIDRAYGRILAAKERMGLTARQHISADEAQAAVSAPERIAFHRELSRRSITLLQGDGDLVRKAKAPLFLASVTRASTGVEDGQHNGMSFARMAADALGGSALDISRSPDGQERAHILQACEEADLVVLGVQYAQFRPGLVELLAQLEDSGKPLAVILLGGPYDGKSVRRAGLVAAAYEYTPLSVASVIDALKTGSYFGRLPIKL